MDRPGYLLSDDLIFTSRIVGTARAHQLDLVSTRTAEQLLRAAHEQPPRCVVVDLANPGLDIAALVKDLKATESSPFVVAYGSHVDTATLKKLREAGCDVVLPRSKFVEELEATLPAWFAAATTPGHSA